MKDHFSKPYFQRSARIGQSLQNVAEFVRILA